MATTLPVNFKDDILGASMNGKRRYQLISNSDGTYSLEDVTEYTQEGSNFGAAQINATNTAVNEKVDTENVIDSLSGIAQNTSSGKVAGALALSEMNKVAMRLPDYSTLTSSEWNGRKSYTATEDCWVVCFRMRSTTGGYGGELKINNVYLFNGSGSSAANYQSVVFPMKKGDTLTSNQYFAGTIQIVGLTEA